MSVLLPLASATEDGNTLQRESLQAARKGRHTAETRDSAQRTTEQNLLALRYIALEVTAVTCNFKPFHCPATVILLHSDR